MKIENIQILVYKFNRKFNNNLVWSIFKRRRVLKSATRFSSIPLRCYFAIGGGVELYKRWRFGEIAIIALREEPSPRGAAADKSYYSGNNKTFIAHLSGKSRRRRQRCRGKEAAGALC